LLGAGGDFGKTSQGEEKGEERERKDNETRRDTLGSIVVERNAREERARDGLGGGWTKTKA